MAAFLSLSLRWGDREVIEVASRVVIEWVVVCVQGGQEMGREGVFFKEKIQSDPRDPIFCTVVALTQHAKYAKTQSNTTFALESNAELHHH